MYRPLTDPIQYAVLLLAAFPEALGKLRAEHDRVFSPDYHETLEILHSDPTRINDLEYTAAVIQETLRFFTAGMPCRQPPRDM